MFLLSRAWPAVADEVSVETVLTGLSHPASVAIRPGGTAERYEVFVADSGAQRVVKISSNNPGRSTDVITGFPDASATGKRLTKGNPFCLLFLDEKHLVAGIAGAPPELRLYELTEADTPLDADALPVLRDDGDDVDRAAAGDRVVDEMGLGPEPEADAG
ncbi:MAG TPA: hypothetical protein VJ828_17580, partial [Lacipirellulaceae bacterium]|nr:hypothetical protein [Lacipirellulaceae bacterium]